MTNLLNIIFDDFGIWLLGYRTELIICIFYFERKSNFNLLCFVLFLLSSVCLYMILTYFHVTHFDMYSLSCKLLFSLIHSVILLHLYCALFFLSFFYIFLFYVLLPIARILVNKLSPYKIVNKIGTDICFYCDLLYPQKGQFMKFG